MKKKIQSNKRSIGNAGFLFVIVCAAFVLVSNVLVSQTINKPVEDAVPIAERELMTMVQRLNDEQVIVNARLKKEMDELMYNIKQSQELSTNKITQVDKVNVASVPDKTIDTLLQQELQREMDLRNGNKAKPVVLKEIEHIAKEPIKPTAPTNVEAKEEVHAPSFEAKHQTGFSYELSDADKSVNLNGKTTNYLRNNAGFPIVLLCYNRPDELTRTLNSLLSVRGVSKDKILVAQDDTDPRVARVVDEFGVLHDQRIENQNLPPKELKDGGMRIARHYKHALSKAFNTFPGTPGIVVVEDDLLFSPDFMEFFVSVAPAVEVDPTLWLASAYNDNGFEGKVGDLSVVKRTTFFPGLGWYLPHSTWKEIEHKWPKNHWDWFMRKPDSHQGRECVYPEVARDFHAGSKGTFMDPKTQEKYFDTIAYNTNANFKWNSYEASYKAYKNAYERRMDFLISHGTPIRSPIELTQELPANSPAFILWYEADIHPTKEKFVKPFAEYFGIWHQLLRGSHEMCHEVLFKGKMVLLINTLNKRYRAKSKWFFPPELPSKYVTSRPIGVPIFIPKNFMRDVNSIPGNDNSFRPTSITIYAASEAEKGLSCSKICDARKLKCSRVSLGDINTCTTLKKYFTCENGCEESMGGDQPAFVDRDAPKVSLPGTCLVNQGLSYFSCDGHFPHTRRLCPCF